MPKHYQYLLTFHYPINHEIALYTPPPSQISSPPKSQQKKNNKTLAAYPYESAQRQKKYETYRSIDHFPEFQARSVFFRRFPLARSLAFFILFSSIPLRLAAAIFGPWNLSIAGRPIRRVERKTTTAGRSSPSSPCRSLLSLGRLLWGWNFFFSLWKICRWTFIACAGFFFLSARWWVMYLDFNGARWDEFCGDWGRLDWDDLNDVTWSGLCRVEIHWGRSDQSIVWFRNVWSCIFACRPWENLLEPERHCWI